MQGIEADWILEQFDLNRQFRVKLFKAELNVMYIGRYTQDLI